MSKLTHSQHEHLFGFTIVVFCVSLDQFLSVLLAFVVFVLVT